MMEVVRMAQIVPTGILACGSAKSPDLFDPAIIPGRESINVNFYLNLEKLTEHLAFKYCLNCSLSLI